jgi:DNA-binding NtrC family response regulator
LTPDAIEVLLGHEWPGNVRELANVMEHAYIIAGGHKITAEHLPHHLRQHAAEPVTLSIKKPDPKPQQATTTSAPAQPRTLKEIEMEHILRVLEKHNGYKVAAAAELGIVLKTLYNKLNQWEEEQKRKAAG